MRVRDPPAGPRLRLGHVHQHRRPGPGLPLALRAATRSRPKRTTSRVRTSTGWCNEEATELLIAGRRRARRGRRVPSSSRQPSRPSWLTTTSCSRCCSSRTSAPTAPTGSTTAQRRARQLPGVQRLVPVGRRRWRRPDHRSVPSSSRPTTARTRSPSAPTRRGSSGTVAFPVLPAPVRHHRRPDRTRSARSWPASLSSTTALINS